MKNSGLVFLLLGAAVLALLFVMFKPEQPAPAPPAAPAPAVAAASPAAPAPAPVDTHAKSFELVVQNKHLVSGPQVLTAMQGDEVSIGIVSDAAEELHLHGYNLKLDLLPGKHGVLRFTADHSGRFEYELEKSRVELGALEVQPK